MDECGYVFGCLEVRPLDLQISGFGDFSEFLFHQKYCISVLCSKTWALILVKCGFELRMNPRELKMN